MLLKNSRSFDYPKSKELLHLQKIGLSINRAEKLLEKRLYHYFRVGTFPKELSKKIMGLR